ncbi:hypothetical protein [Paludibaculum fermentans]|uniref:Uncharacterized protein n=1 Tax=Paludibaculum fermentans TaxID=1473598 RepID=A0A7S7SMD0_PALFE|nr:hypothetical protein [Paludibaculum fermentans]QOY88960.1 hypothetical protein IRI77_03075 [Paludibaculum fermentans]
MANQPISERRLAANRANAQKSTGPRTAEGKLRVSQNATRHNLYSGPHRLPEDIEARLYLIGRCIRPPSPPGSRPSSPRPQVPPGP